jgi:hypothetical protein
LATTVPAAALTTPHTPELHVCDWQAVFAPQSLAAMHCTQEPAPLHCVPPPWLQAVP